MYSERDCAYLISTSSIRPLSVSYINAMAIMHWGRLQVVIFKGPLSHLQLKITTVTMYHHGDLANRE
jgi:hypothetical protein